MMSAHLRITALCLAVGSFLGCDAADPLRPNFLHGEDHCPGDEGYQETDDCDNSGEEEEVVLAFEKVETRIEFINERVVVYSKLVGSQAAYIAHETTITYDHGGETGPFRDSSWFTQNSFSSFIGLSDGACGGVSASGSHRATCPLCNPANGSSNDWDRCEN